MKVKPIENKFALRQAILTMVAVLPVLLCAVSVQAQGRYDQPVAAPMLILAALAALAFVPVILVMGTAFIKLAVVFAIIRNAIGTQQIPPNQVITGLAFVLTIYIMMPVALEMKREMGEVVSQKSNQGFFSEASLGIMVEAAKRGQEPYRNFLIKHAHVKERNLFYNLAYKMRVPVDRAELSDKDFSILLPAFVISELTEAFFVGFVIFLPFLVIDMVIANILLSLGMFQLSPVTVSLPFKLLMFVLVDGWHLITQSIIEAYK